MLKKFNLRFAVRVAVAGVILAGLGAPVSLTAQSDDSTPLGDIARALRKEKEQKTSPDSSPVIDNDNFSQVMKEVEKEREKGAVHLSFSGIGKDLQVSSPDVTCNLSFDANSAALLSDAFVPEDLPVSDLLKLDGPAVIQGDSLEVTVFNPTGWTIREITVGLTIARPGEDSAVVTYGPAKLLPAVSGTSAPSGKRPDLTVLYHLKGLAAPMSTTVFRQNLGATLQPNQDWHWAIVQAQGLPPAPSLPPTPNPSPAH